MRLPRCQVNYYLSSYLPEDEIYVPEAPSVEEAAVLGDDGPVTPTRGWCAVLGAGGCVDAAAISRHRCAPMDANHERFLRDGASFPQRNTLNPIWHAE
jgi:hypothetical protein